MTNNATTVADYSVGQKVVHWLLALFLLIDLTVAQQFGGQLALADRLQNREGHAAVGTIILTLFIIRVILRIKNGAPAFPTTMPAWQRAAAYTTHYGFYVLIAVTLITGVITASNASAPINWFGATDIAFLGNTSEEQFQAVRAFHEYATQVLIAFIVVHVAAAFYHLLISRDGRFGRMLKFWKNETA
jgi:cytochrome b561